MPSPWFLIHTLKTREQNTAIFWALIFFLYEHSPTFKTNFSALTSLSEL